MKLRVGINGFGRIGRGVLRVMSRREEIMEVVAINDLYSAEQLAYLLAYDTVMGPIHRPISHERDALIVDGHRIQLFSEREPGRIPWGEVGADLIVEATGVFRHREKIEPHLAAGAKRVILTVPPKDEVDAIVVLGVNDHVLAPEHRIVSNASCTTNCLAPVVKAIDDVIGFERGLITTVHAYTNDQRLADVPHKDFRRARAATQNLIPTTTGAARAVGKVLPHLKGRLDGRAVRVPVADGSVVDLLAEFKRETDVEEINAAVLQAAEGPMKSVLEYTEAPLVSSDIILNPHSSIFDARATQRVGARQARLLAWYDNEWGYSNRVVDLSVRLAEMMQ
ncbi:MAG: type I glyceraldehyde-3-phosphate dehydrogenase [Acidobacteriota bacterium]|nr:MAG: type I glyceraldehyde-3-phosphate dehydrogenase [Acidobacteriota bacterium]